MEINKEKMSELFDAIPIGKNLEYSDSDDDLLLDKENEAVSFEQKCKSIVDMLCILDVQENEDNKDKCTADEETVTTSNNSNTKKLNVNKNKNEHILDDNKLNENLEEKEEFHKHNENKEHEHENENENEYENEEIYDKDNTENKNHEDLRDIDKDLTTEDSSLILISEQVNKDVNEIIAKKLNLINLGSQYIEPYKNILKVLPNYKLTDGTVTRAFFYKCKFEQTYILYKKFGFPNIATWKEELDNIYINNFVGEIEAHPDLIRSKLDMVQQQRVRLGTIRYQIIYRLPSIKRIVEMLRGKLFKDHDIKGAHKRDGMCLEHMGELESYLAELEGADAAAKHIDDILMAQSESLSRQITCLQMKIPLGLAYDQIKTKKQNEAENRSTDMYNVKDGESNIDKFDEINEGEKIGPPKKNRPFPVVSWSISSENDPLGNIGI